MIEIPVTTVLLITFLINLLIIKCIGKWKQKNYPKGPWGLPIVGHLPFFGSNPPETFARWRKQYGDVFQIRMGSWKTVVVNGYESVKTAAEMEDTFSSRPNFITAQLLKEANGEVSLAFGPFNETYLLHRKLTASALRMVTGRRSDSTEELIANEADVLAEKLLHNVGKGPKDVRCDIQYATGSVIYQVLYGKGSDIGQQLKKMVDGSNEFIKFTGTGNPFDVMPWLQYVMPRKVSAFRKMLIQSVPGRRQQVKEHCESFSSEKIRDVADALLAADIEENNASKNRGLSRSRLVTTLADLQGAGFETSNKSLQWLILYMSKYPDVQSRVQKEIDDVIGTGNRVHWKDRTRLLYTQATILEVMRMISVTPFALPKSTTQNSKLNGYDIEKDTVVFFNLHSVSHDTEFWGDPENFRPDRLLTSDMQLDSTKISHIIPFGLGRRRCVGEQLARMEMFLLFTNLIRKCVFVAPDGEELDLTPEPGLTYSPRDFSIIVEKR